LSSVEQAKQSVRHFLKLKASKPNSKLLEYYLPPYYATTEHYFIELHAIEENVLYEEKWEFLSSTHYN
jgi:hypothetical protein